MYDAGQKRLIARELARHGGIVERAVAALQTQYESMDRIGATTIRRLMRDCRFKALMREQELLLNAAQAQGDADAETKKAETESLGKSDLVRILKAAINKAAVTIESGDMKPMASMLVAIQTLEKINGPSGGNKQFSIDSD